MQRGRSGGNPQLVAANREIAAEAFHKKLCLRFSYRGCDRVVEVHAIGITPQGHAALSGFQVGGKSNSTELPGWRLFLLGQCRQMKISELPAEAPRPDYRPDSELFRTVLVQF